jgi:hypothetical protein
MHRREVYSGICRNTAQRGAVKTVPRKELFGTIQDFFAAYEGNSWGLASA